MRRSGAASMVLAVSLVLTACSNGDDGNGSEPADPDASASADETAGDDAGDDAGGETAPSEDGDGASGTDDGSNGEPQDGDVPAVGTTVLDPVPVGEEAAFGEGLVVVVTDLEDRDLEAGGPGEVAGPGVVVRLEVRNDASEPIDLAGFVVNAYLDDGIPAAPATGAFDGEALAGMLAPEETAEGEYAFFVPESDTGSLVIEAHHVGSANIVTIEP